MNHTNPCGARNTNDGPDSSNGTFKPNGADIERLRDLIFTHAVKGEMGQRVLKYLVAVMGAQERICAQDITDHGGPVGDENVCPLMSRIRYWMHNFFDYELIARMEPYRLAFPKDDRGNYALHVEPNRPPVYFVEPFWRPHLSGAGLQIAYPIIPLTSDAISHCITNGIFSKGGQAEALAVEKSIDLPAGDGVVHQGLVRSAFHLTERFHKWQVGVAGKAISPNADVLEGSNAIVLATAGSMPRLLPVLEAAGWMKTGVDRVTVTRFTKSDRNARKYSHTLENGSAGSGFDRLKRGVLTRHRFPFQRTITVIAGNDECAVETMVQFLLNEDAMLNLARELRCGHAFPDHFQALLRMNVCGGHPYASHIAIEETAILA